MLHPEALSWLLDTVGAVAIGGAIFLLLVWGVVIALSRWDAAKPYVRRVLDFTLGPALQNTVRERVRKEVDESLTERVSDAVRSQLDQRVPNSVKAEVDDRMAEYNATKEAKLEAKLAERRKDLERQEKRYETIRDAVLHSVAVNARVAKDLSKAEKPLRSHAPSAVSLSTWDDHSEDFKRYCDDGKLLAMVPEFFEIASGLKERLKSSPRETSPNLRAQEEASGLAAQGARILNSLPSEERRRITTSAGIDTVFSLTD